MTGAHHRLFTVRANTPRDSNHLPAVDPVLIGFAALFLVSAFMLFFELY